MRPFGQCHCNEVLGLSQRLCWPLRCCCYKASVLLHQGPSSHSSHAHMSCFFFCSRCSSAFLESTCKGFFLKSGCQHTQSSSSSSSSIIIIIHHHHHHPDLDLDLHNHRHLHLHIYRNLHFHPHPHPDPQSVFTDHTLAHPLNCRGGVVARLSA